MRKLKALKTLLGTLLLSAGSTTLFTALVLADLDKDQKDAKDQKEARGPKVKTHEELHRELEAEGQATLKEIARLMEKIQNDLDKKNTGASTQENQQAVVKKIEELIDKLGKG